MDALRSFSTPVFIATLALLLPGVSSAQWIIGGPLDTLGERFPSNAPVIWGFHSDGATNTSLPGTWGSGIITGGEELALAPGVTVFTQTVTTPVQ
jgi:hypothetical protein